MWQNIKKSYKNNKFKIPVPTQCEKFELLDGLYSASDIQDYFEYFIKKHETLSDNPQIRIYVNKIENRITFKIERGYYLKFITLATVILLGNAKSKITKNENGEHAPHLEITEIILVQDSRVLYTFVPNQSLVNCQIFHLKCLLF